MISKYLSFYHTSVWYLSLLLNFHFQTFTAKMMATASTWVRSICSQRCISYHRSWVLSCVWHKTHCHTTCEQLSPSAGSEHNLDTSRGRATVYLHIRLCISAMLRILVFIIILWLKELLHLKRSNFIIFQALKFYLFYQQIKSFRLKLDFKSDKSFLQQVSKYQQVLYVKSFFEGPEGGNWCLKNNPEHCKQAHFAPLYLIEWQTAKKKGLSLTEEQTAASTATKTFMKMDWFILCRSFYSFKCLLHMEYWFRWNGMW